MCNVFMDPNGKMTQFLNDRNGPQKKSQLNLVLDDEIQLTQPDQKDKGNVAPNEIEQLPWRGICTVIGCISVHLTLGNVFDWGNLTTYVTSYIRKDSHPHDLTYETSYWVAVIMIGSMSVIMYVGGLFGRRYGDRLVIFLGCIAICLGNILSLWTIQTSFVAFVFTFSILQGLGVGFVYAQAIALACRWFPEQKGLIIGFIVAGYGCGGAIFNGIITHYINPDNEQANVVINRNSYFDQESVLERVPTFFSIMGIIFGGIQFVGLTLMFEPNANGCSLPLLRWIMPCCNNDNNNISICCLKKNENESESVIAINGQEEESHSLSEEESSLHKSEAIIPELSTEKPVTQKNYTPKETLMSWHFWLLNLTFSCNGAGILFIIGVFKLYGQSCSYDDHFLGIVAALTSVANGTGRILWGTVADRIGYKASMACVTCITMALMLALDSTSAVGPGLYAVFISAIFFSCSGTYALVPTALAKAFGDESLAENLGLLSLFTLPAAIISGLVQSEIGKLEWYGQFWIVAACFLPSFIATLLFPTYTKEGFKI